MKKIRSSASGIHRSHDRLLIARVAAGDAETGDLARARRLVAECEACAELMADLTSLTRATAALPMLRAPRDFRLTRAQAERLRGGSLIDRVLRGIASPRLRPLEGLASAALSLGIVLAGVSLFMPVASQNGGAQRVALEAEPGASLRGDHVAAFDSPEPAEGGPKATGAAGGEAPLEGESIGEPTAGTVTGNAAIRTPGATSHTGFDAAPQASAQATGGEVRTRRDDEGDGTAVQLPGDGDEASSRPDILRPLLLVGGLLLAVIGLAFAGLRTVARRRASDPLVR